MARLKANKSNATVYGKKPSSESDLKLYSYVVMNAKKVSQEIFSTIEQSPLNKGGILFITGPVNSGKSVVGCELINLFAQLNGKRSFAAYQPAVDRPDVLRDRIFSRSGENSPAFSYASKNDIESMFHDHSVVLVDEIQFTPFELQSNFLKEAEIFVERGGWLVAIGLRYSSLQTEFLLPALLYERSKKNYELVATCQMCGRRKAVRNQRFVNGKVSSYHDDDLIPPSDNVVYEPRCLDCLVT